MRDWEGSLPDFSFQRFLSNTVHLSSIVSGALGQIEGHPQRFFGKLFTLSTPPPKLRNIQRSQAATQRGRL